MDLNSDRLDSAAPIFAGRLLDNQGVTLDTRRLLGALITEQRDRFGVAKLEEAVGELFGGEADRVDYLFLPFGNEHKT